MAYTPSDTPETNEPGKRAPHVSVIDLPTDMTADDMAQLIESNCDGMYLLAVVPWPGTGARAFFREHAQKPKREKDESGTKDKDYATADAILRKYPNLKPGKIADKLAAKGIVWHPLAIAGRRRHLELTDMAADAKREAR